MRRGDAYQSSIKGEKFYQKAIQIYGKLGEKKEQLDVMHHLGMSYVHSKNSKKHFSKVLRMCEKMEKIAKEINERYYLSISYMIKFSAYSSVNNVRLAQKYWNMSDKMDSKGILVPSEKIFE